MKILFLCTGNSCRSQMAEGFARHHGRGVVTAASAGIEAHGLNPTAVDVMGEIGIDISQHKSKTVDEAMIAAADLIITVCDHAQERCPVIPGHVRRLHWSFEDPARVMGTEDQVRAVFRRVRDEIGAKIKSVVEQEEMRQRV